MKASETKFQPIIEGVKQYVVPLFQRSYSWEKKEWDVLWGDLLDLNDSDNPKTHFIGSIVSMPTNSVPEGISKYLLIDGQQRLTTIFILLTVIRDLSRLSGHEELSEEINDTFVVNRYKKNSTDYYKLLPTQIDRKSFQDLILGNNENIKKSSQILKAYQYFERKLKQSKIELQQLLKLLTTHLSVVSIVLDPDDNPHLVFESLNAKGRPLTQSDLIRNFFFMRIHTQEQDHIYREYWKPMEDLLGDNLTEFMRHYLMKDGAWVKKSDVYFSLKDLVAQGDALTYLIEINVFAHYYYKLLKPQSEPNVKIRRMLDRLQRLEATTVFPFLLNIYNDYNNNDIDENYFVSILSIIENFLIRRFVCAVPTNQLNKIFPPLYSQIKKENPNDFVGGLKHQLQGKAYPKDGEFVTRLSEVKLYGAGDRARKTKLILEAIEESYNHKEAVPFNSLTIEHIMPQTLTPFWQDYLGNEWEMVQDLNLHTLGNLTLTAYNTELSNDDFLVKKQKLSASHLEMNNYFKDISSWKKDDIEERGKYLAKQCLNIWPYFGETTQESNGNNVTGTSPRMLWILGQHFEVKSWRDVMEETINTIAELEPEKFDVMVEKFPRFVGKDRNKFRAIRDLKNGYFMEVNLSAKQIRQFCIQAIETIELTTDDWDIEFS